MKPHIKVGMLIGYPPKYGLKWNYQTLIVLHQSYCHQSYALITYNMLIPAENQS